MDLSEHSALTNFEIEYVKQITNSGELYYDYDPLISKARNHAYFECRKYDNELRNGRKKDRNNEGPFCSFGTSCRD